jgi:unsaturated rhamnogalacturonyl hydrolase
MKAIALTAILLTASLVSEIVRSTAQQVASWQMSHFHEVSQAPETDWTGAVFYIGLARWAATPAQMKYFDAIRELGERTGWQIGNSDWAPPIYLADDHAIGQVYSAAYDHFGGRRMIEATVQRLEYILQHPPQVSLEFDHAECLQRWCWSDAIFMGPATWFGIARIQKDQRFSDYADREFWATKDLLFDSQEHLFYRDSRFIEKTGAHGERYSGAAVTAGCSLGLPTSYESFVPVTRCARNTSTCSSKSRIASRASSARMASGPRRCSLRPT